MKNRFIAGLTLMAFMSLGVPTMALSSEKAMKAQVEASTGKVLARAEAGWNAVDGQDLAPGTLVRTGQDGEVILHFPGDSRVRVSANSDLRVVDINENGTTLLLERGRVLGHAGDALSIGTTRSNTVASEGNFVVSTSATGTELEVLDGNAKMSSDENVETPNVDLPEGVDTEALADVDELGSIQMVGEVAQEDDDDEAGGAGEDNSWIAYTAGGVAVVVTVLLATQNDDDDEIVGNPSPVFP